MILRILCSNKIIMISETSKGKVLNTSFLKPFYCLDISIVENVLKNHKILITSRNGVMGLLENLKYYGIESNKIENKEILTVGSKTFDLLIQNGFLNVNEDSINITALKQKHQLDGVLYLSGFHTSFHDYSSYGVIRKIIYNTIPMPLDKITITKIKHNEMSHVFLYSKRNVEAFLGNFPSDYEFGNLRFICISENVASALKSRSENVIFPLIPTKEEMLKLVS
jgi:uroporphyrinogen-III synthase